jgi:acetylornithine aminotransferase
MNSHLLWYPGYELLIPDIVRAEGCRLYDSGGKEYLDLESGVWCASIGHGHPRLRRVLAEQPARIAHSGYSYSNEIVETAAREILSLLGFDGGKCVFLCSGSEAVEYGVRVAQMISRRPLLMTMADSYFGAYGSASKKQEDEWFCLDWSTCGCATGKPAAGASTPEFCSSECRAWTAIPRDRIGGFLFEPGSSSGFVRFPPACLIRSIGRAMAESGGLFLVNEVTTGIGRTGQWFGFQHYGAAPDIVAMGKGIGSGYPVAVAAFNRSVVERLGGRPVRYAQSHQNDPLGAAVAREVVATIREENLVDNARAMGEALRGGLEAIRARTGRIREVRGRGLMNALELDDAEHARRVHRGLLDRGYIVALRPGTPVFRIDPPLTVTQRDLGGFLETFERVLASIA